MTKFKASLPREKPPENKSNFVFAFMDSKGERMELSGRMSSNDVHNFIREMIISMKNTQS